jgi:hypothetical protein
MRGIEKERRNNVLALGSHCFIFRHSNQPIVGGSDGSYHGEDVRGGAESKGGCCLFVRGCKLNDKTKEREGIMNWPLMAAISSLDTTIN